MAIPLKNFAYDKIKEQSSLTNDELSKILAKAGYVIPDAEFNKILLDLEILGLIKVSWLTKDTQRIEVIIQKEERDEIEAQNKEMMEKDYEASFPGTENGQ
jgi:Ca2+-binding EF-hand superfamily protein